MRFLILSLLLYALALNLRGQEPQQQPTQGPQQTPAAQEKARTDEAQDIVRITTKLVQVDVVVTRGGQQVTDLKPEDFEIFEDGRAQTITNFSYISNLPAAAVANSKLAPAPPTKDNKEPPVILAPPSRTDIRRTIALVVDDLGMSFESMARVRKQLRKFLDEQLQPDDLVAIIRTGGEVGTLQQFTTDKRRLHSALENLKWNPCSRGGLSVLPPARSINVDNRNLCSIDAIVKTFTALRFILRGLRDLPGRKSMLIFSDSLPVQQQEFGLDDFGLQRPGQKAGNESVLDNSTNYSNPLQRLAELAIRASVVIYGVDSSGLQTTGPNAADEISYPPLGTRTSPDQDPILKLMRTRSSAMRRNREGADLIARQTGGFLIRNANDFGLRQVIDDQQGYYLIGYRPGDETFNRRFHHIKARVKRSGLTVRTRAGFYGVTEEEARTPELTAGDQMNKALMSPFGANDMTVRLTTFFANDATAGSLLRSFLFLDARDLSFTEQPDGTHEASFDLSSIMFGDNGRVISRQDRVATLRLRGNPFARVMREGIIYGFDMPVNEFGTFQFRVAVHDRTSSRIGAAGKFVEVPNLNNNRLALSGIVVRDEETLHAPSSSNEPATAENDEVTSGPAVRRFQQGATLLFAYAVYNAQFDKATQLPRLSAQTRIFRDGKPIYTGSPTALEVAGQADLRRITAAARFQLGPELSPGEYIVQIIVQDHLAHAKQHAATQWIDFEVVK